MLLIVNLVVSVDYVEIKSVCVCACVRPRVRPRVRARVCACVYVERHYDASCRISVNNRHIHLTNTSLT